MIFPETTSFGGAVRYILILLGEEKRGCVAHAAGVGEVPMRDAGRKSARSHGSGWTSPSTMKPGAKLVHRIVRDEGAERDEQCVEASRVCT